MKTKFFLIMLCLLVSMQIWAQNNKDNNLRNTTTSSYIDIDYSNITSSKAASGRLNILNDQIVFKETTSLCKGYSFNVVAGKRYNIICYYTSTQTTNFNSGFSLLTGNPLQGNESDIISTYTSSSGNVTYTMIEATYDATTNKTLRILLHDFSMTDFFYNLSISESTTPTKYTTLSYPNIPTNGTQINGHVNSDNLVEDWGESISTSIGYSFITQAGKKYEISCNFYSESTMHPFITNLLTGDAFQGNITDLIDSNGNGNKYGGSSLITYTANKSGSMRILLSDWFKGEYMYSISIKELADPIPTTMTLTDLLNNKSKNINYSNNLSFTDNGMLDLLVIGNSGMNFHPYDINNTSSYYTGAFKTDLPQNGTINISTKVQYIDADIYLYKKTGSTYTLLNTLTLLRRDKKVFSFTATEAGAYYIVISDQCQYPLTEPNPFYFSIWNTLTEPVNNYVFFTNFVSNNYTITVPQNATETDIRLKLMSLLISGNSCGNNIIIDNNPYHWIIESNKATYLPASTEYCTVSESASPVVVNINYFTSDFKNNTLTSPTTVYSYNQSIIVKDSEVGSRISIFDITGKMIINKNLSSIEEIIPINKAGIYVVLVGSQAVKVMVK